MRTLPRRSGAGNRPPEHAPARLRPAAPIADRLVGRDWLALRLEELPGLLEGVPAYRRWERIDPTVLGVVILASPVGAARVR